MTFDEFIGKWNGKGIDFDGYYGDQCMDLMHQYHVEVLGITDGRTLAASDAKSVYHNFANVFNNHLFEKIPNTPTGVPQKGDIILWGTGIGPWGHVAIFIDGDANKFRSFDQNFPTGSKCAVVTHDYKGVLGWLRAKESTKQVSIDSETFEQLVGKSTKYDAFNAAGYFEVDDLFLKLDELHKEKENLRTDLERRIEEGAKELEESRKAQITLNNKISDLTEAIKKDAMEDDDTLKKLLALTESHKTLIGNYRAVKEALELPSDASLTDVLSVIDKLREPNDELLKDREKLFEILFTEYIKKRVVKHKGLITQVLERIKTYVTGLR